MKNKNILSALLIVLAFTGCDKIDAPYRETNTGGFPLGDSAVVISGDTIVISDDTSAAVTRVLVEDYTGHLCGTCPRAGQTLNDTLKPLFGERVAIVTIHSDHFASPCPGGLDCPGSAPVGAFSEDYRTTVGSEWTTLFGINANPLGMINRGGYPSTHKKVYTDWKSSIENELALTPSVGIQIKSIYNSTSRELKAAVRSELLQDLTGGLKLQVVVVEDSVVGWQQWYSHSPQLVPDYLHRDVLRATLNGNFGDVLSATGGDNGMKFINGYSLTLDPTWNVDHCKVVAFVYDETTYHVYQALEMNVIQ